MKKYAVLLLTVLVWMGCKKKDENKPCEGGVLQIINNSAHPFRMEIDNVEVKKISGSKKDYHTLQPGAYMIKFIQEDGFAVSPVEYEYDVEIKMCDTATRVIHKVANSKTDYPDKK